MDEDCGPSGSAGMTRRACLAALGAVGLSLALPPCLARAQETRRRWPNLPEDAPGKPSTPDPLVTPWTLGGITVPNRIVKSATGEGMADGEGRVTPAYVDFYVRLARGGAGLLITGNMYTRPSGIPRQIVLAEDKVAGLERVVRAVHAEKRAIFAQINDPGGHARGSYARSPSEMRERRSTSREMEKAEVGEAILGYGRAAALIRKTGFDGVEIHGSHDYLISEFLNPKWNRRRDDYGGSTEKRQRFALEVYEEVRGAVGPSFPILLKLDGDFGDRNAQDTRDQAALARQLDQAGLDGFDVSCSGAGQILTGMIGTGPFQENRNVPAARVIKGAVKKPVLVVGSIREPDCMRAIVRERYADAVSLARPLIRDPEWPNRILGGARDRSACTNTARCFLGLVVGPAYCRYA